MHNLLCICLSLCFCLVLAKLCVFSLHICMGKSLSFCIYIAQIVCVCVFAPISVRYWHAVMDRSSSLFT